VTNEGILNVTAKVDDQDVSVFNDAILDDDMIETLKGNNFSVVDNLILEDIKIFEKLVRDLEPLLRDSPIYIRTKFVPKLETYKIFYEKFGGDVSFDELNNWFNKLKTLLTSLQNESLLYNGGDKLKSSIKEMITKINDHLKE